MIDVRNEADKIIEDASDLIIGQIEVYLDEGDWRNAVFQLTDRLGASAQDHAEILGWIDILISQAVAKALMERTAQAAEERL